MKNIILTLVVLFVLSLHADSQTTDFVYPQNAYVTQFGAIEVDIDGHGYVAGSCDVLMETSDYGQTWSLIEQPEEVAEFEFIFCVDGDCDNALFFGYDRIYIRQNGEFSLVFQDDEVGYIESVTQISDGTLIASNDHQGAYLRSTDKGSTWQINTLPKDKRSIIAGVPNRNILYYFDEDGMMMKSADGSNSFSSTGYTLDDNVYPTRSLTFYDENNGWYYHSSERTYYETQDGGMTWNKISSTFSFNRNIKFVPISQDTLITINLT